MTFKYLINSLFATGIIITANLSLAQNNQIANTSVLVMSENHRYLKTQNGSPFLWIGGTVWGMSEWMTREEIDLYLDNRKSKGFNIIQICLLWGKRTEDPVNFTVNAPNAYGFSAFKMPLVPGELVPDTRSGGTTEQPNDYWDHVDYILQAAKDRDILMAILPVWGRRYVNGTHGKHSLQLFTPESMRDYGKFLGNRYRSADHIIWVMGGDVKADAGGDFRSHYRSMAEGIIEGLNGSKIKWNQRKKAWDKVMMTYHPDGAPHVNSSTWFHNDPWLDFNMIETHKDQSEVHKAVAHDYHIQNPIKPTVMGEPAYEGIQSPELISDSRDMRRQAYHTFFAGGAGFTYGAYTDSEGRGPLFSPTNDWQEMLDMEGAYSMKWVRKFCKNEGWPHWQPVTHIITEGKMEGVLEKVSVTVGSGDKYLVYFPDRSSAKLSIPAEWKGSFVNVMWYNPKNGEYTSEEEVREKEDHIIAMPPASWMDGVLILIKN